MTTEPLREPTEAEKRTLRFLMAEWLRTLENMKTASEAADATEDTRRIWKTTSNHAKETIKFLFGESISKERSNSEENWIREDEARGRAETARRMTQRFLVKRFGTLPTALLKRIAQADADWCDNLFDRAADAASLVELADLYANAPE